MVGRVSVLFKAIIEMKFIHNQLNTYHEKNIE